MSAKVQNPSNKGILILSATFVSLLIFGLIFEGAVRVRQWVKYGTPTELHQFIIDSETGLRIPGPGANIGRIKVNSYGFRSPEIAVQKDRETIRLAFLGGSTTWCAEVSGNELTWPHLVWGNLHQSYPDLKFDYLNAAFPGYSTEESLIRLESNVKKFKPDVIIIYHGTNDLSYETRKLAKDQGIYVGKPEDPSWLGRVSLAWFLIEKNIALYFRQQSASQGDSSLSFDPNEISNNFEKRLFRLVRASKEIAPIVALATFSHKFKRSQSKEDQIQSASSAIFYMPYMTVEKLFKAFEEYNRVIREVAKRTKIILVEEENLIPGDALHFNDSVHFTDAGSKVMAQRVGNAIKGSAIFAEFLASKRH